MMQKEIKNILVPVNFSEASNNALQTAIAMCKRHNATLHLVNVLESELLVPMAGMQVPATGIVAELELSREENLANMADAIQRNHGLSCRYYTEAGFIPYVICAKAEELDCDLVVTGTAGTKVKKIMRADNAMAILKNCSIPVLIVPSGRRVLDFRNILFPVRPVLNALSKYKTVFPIIKKNNARVLLMGAINEQEGEKVKTIKQMVDSTAVQMKSQNIHVDRKLYFGKGIAREIIATSNRKNTDLLVITAALRRGLKQFFVPGFVQKMINESVIPVLCVKPGFGVEEHAVRSILHNTRLV